MKGTATERTEFHAGGRGVKGKLIDKMKLLEPVFTKGEFRGKIKAWKKK